MLYYIFAVRGFRDGSERQFLFRVCTNDAERLQALDALDEAGLFYGMTIAVNVNGG